MNWLLARVLNATKAVAHKHNWVEVQGPSFQDYEYLYEKKWICTECPKERFGGQGTMKPNIGRDVWSGLPKEKDYDRLRSVSRPLQKG